MKSQVGSDRLNRYSRLAALFGAAPVALGETSSEVTHTLLKMSGNDDERQSSFVKER